MTPPDRQRYLSYAVEDLLSDDRFVNWCLRPEPEESRSWNDLADRDVDFAAKMERARKLVLDLKTHYQDQQPGRRESERAYERLLQRGQMSNAPATRRPLLRWSVAAAVALLIVGLAGLYLSGALGEQERYYYETAYGERLHIELPDGSVVDLNANSSLEYLPAPKGVLTARLAVLSGEAFFQVAKDEDGRGFQVDGNGLKVNVLGTRFGVYARGSASAVTLEEGSVLVDYAMADRRDSVLMEPGERLSYDTISKAVASERIAVDPVLAWKDGHLIFQNERLRDAADRLEEIFGVEIAIADRGMGDRLIHLSTSADDLEVFFSTLDKLSPKQLIVQRDGNTIRLSERDE